MRKRIMMTLIILSMMFMGISIRPVCSFAENDEDDFWGIGLYYDSDFLKKIVENYDVEDPNFSYGYARLNVLKNKGAKAYLRMKDSTTEGCDPNPEKKLVQLYDDYDNPIDNQTADRMLTITELPSSVKGDKRYMLVFGDDCGFDKITMSVNYLVNNKETGETWECETVADTIIDYVDDGLNLTNRSSVYYNQYCYVDKNNRGAFMIYEGNEDYSGQDVLCVPGKMNIFSIMLCKEDGYRFIDDPQKLSVYASDGKTIADGIRVVYNSATGTDKLMDEMRIVVEKNVAFGRYILRYNDGERDYDVDLQVGLPDVGAYTSTDMNVNTLLEDTEVSEGKEVSFYVLSNKENAGISYGEELHNYADDAYDMRVKSVKQISEVGVNGICVTAEFESVPGELKTDLFMKSDGTDNNIAKSFVFFRPINPSKGDVVKENGNSYRITKAAKGYGSMGNAVLIKAGKKKTDWIHYVINKAGRHYYIKSIKAKAYKNNTKITSITIGSDFSVSDDRNGSMVSTIEAEAFYGCKSLKKIDLSHALKIKRIGKNAFKKIHKKATVIVPKKMKKKYSKLIKQAGFTGTIKAV